MVEDPEFCINYDVEEFLNLKIVCVFEKRKNPQTCSLTLEFPNSELFLNKFSYVK
jgi:hypothetical protein